jgi:hypothetical protein
MLIGFLAMPSIMETSIDGSSYFSQHDDKDQIEIGAYEDKTKDGQLLVLGYLTNKGDKPASSI